MTLPKGIVATGFPAVEETCRHIGILFDEWERGLNRAILAKDRAGLYAADTVAISICRQAGKTYDVGALVFADCIINPGTTVVWTAHRFKVARETFNELRAWCKSPLMVAHVDYDAITTAAGNECIPFRNGSRIVFAARERGAIRGFTKVRRLILDEGQILTEAALADLAPTLNQAENPQIVIMGTPPKPNDPGEVFKRIRSEALDEDELEGVLYVEFSAEPGCSPDNREQWRVANPSYPKRTSTKAILRLRKLLSPEDFMREALGVWDEDDATSLVWPAELWHSRRSLDSPPKPGGVGLALSVDRAWGSVGASSGGSPQYLGSVLHDRGASWMVAEAARLQREHGMPVAVDGRGPAATLIPQLEDAGVIVTTATTEDYLTACADLYDAVIEGTVVHGDHGELNSAVEAATQRPVGDRWAWARKNGDITMLEAVTLARWVAQDNITPDIF